MTATFPPFVERSPNASLIEKIKGGQYSAEQFRALTKEEKERVVKYQEETGKKRGGKRNKSKASKRRLSKAESKRDEPEAAEEKGEDNSTPTTGAGSQFGMNGNRNKKSKKD